jgi:hypothetical protein
VWQRKKLVVIEAEEREGELILAECEKGLIQRKPKYKRAADGGKAL